eukprot:5245782-Pyramimonas_sp.AAC.1
MASLVCALGFQTACATDSKPAGLPAGMLSGAHLGPQLAGVCFRLSQLACASRSQLSCALHPHQP